MSCSHWLHESDVRKRLEQAHYLCVPRHRRRMLLLCFYFKGDAQQCVSRASRGHVATITQLAASPAQDAGTRHGDPGATLTPPRPSCAEVLLSRSPRITATFCFAFRSQFVKLGWLIVLSQWLTSLSRPYEVHYFRALILLSSTRVCGVTQEGPGDPAHKAAARRTPHRTCPVPGDYNISCYCGEHWPVSRLSSLFVILTLFTLLTSAAMVLGPIVFIVSTSKYFPRQQRPLSC